MLYTCIYNYIEYKIMLKNMYKNIAIFTCVHQIFSNKSKSIIYDHLLNQMKDL